MKSLAFALLLTSCSPALVPNAAETTCVDGHIWISIREPFYDNLYVREHERVHNEQIKRHPKGCEHFLRSYRRSAAFRDSIEHEADSIARVRILPGDG